jgi:hypothetical protein
MVALPAMNVTVPVGTPAPVVTPRPPPEPIPPQAFPPPRVTAPSASDWDEAAPASRGARGASISPFVALDAEPAAPFEPSFELVHPRKKRGALWLVLGAALAIAAFAARPWLARQVAATTGGALPDRLVPNSEPVPRNLTPSASPVPADTATARASDAASAVGIASTPAVPSERPTRARPGRSEQHVIIDDRLQLEPPPPVEKKPEPAREPPPPPPSPPPQPAPKPKPPPVSEADRYGI